MEAISEAALRLFDRWLTDAMGTRPDAHRSRGGRTRAPMAPNEDALQDDRVSYRFAERGAKRRHFPILRDA